MKMLPALALAAIALAPVALPGVASAAPSSAPASSQVVKTDDGYVMGLASAPIKLTVISSFGCPHCSDFDRASTAELRRDWVDTGKVQVRFVPYMLFPTDIPAMILADCGDPKTFFHRADALFARRDETAGAFAAMSPAVRDTLQKADEHAQTVGILHQSRLDESYGALGLKPVQANACVADHALRVSLRERQKLALTRYQVKGTPTVLVNGRPVPPSWPAIRQLLATLSKR